MLLQTDTLHLFYNRPRVTQPLLDSVVHFYLSGEFQQWSYRHHSNLMADPCVWASHKEPLKRYIFEFDGDAEYYAGKTKVKSAHNVWGYQLGLTDSLHTIHFGRLSASRERFRARYGRTLHARFVEGELSVLDE